MNINTSNIGDIQGLSEYFNKLDWKDLQTFEAHAAFVTDEGKHQPLVTHIQLVRLTTAMRETGNYRISSCPWFQPSPQNIATRGGIMYE
jgi:hypothetical protein